jgi:hypothetical protein
MASDEMPDWARDMRIMVQILMDRVNTLELQTEERRTAEILDPSARIIAEKAERIAKSARDIVDSTGSLTSALVRSLMEEKNRTSKMRDQIGELKRRVDELERHLPGDGSGKSDLKW